MKKFFVTYFIWLFIVQLGGYSKLYAHTDTMGLFENIEKATAQKSFSSSEQHLDITIKSTCFLTEKQGDKIDPTDNEDEEEELSSLKLIAAKKFVAVTNYFTSAFNTKVPEYTSNTLKNNVPPCERFFIFPTQRLHLIFRVIRI